MTLPSPPAPTDFGVIITCAKKDFLFAKGCCASVRYFAPDVPICLLVDGNFDLDGLDTTYRATVLRREQVKNDFLRKHSFGYGITKMVAFWESPFQHFLLIDADTCWWGDVRPSANFAHHDCIIDQPRYAYTNADINKWFFNTALLKQHYPDFEPFKYDHHYTCTGVIFARRGLFDIDYYKSVFAKFKSVPGMFLSGEMGYLNFMFFQAAEQGHIKLGHALTQHLVPDFSREFSAEAFPFAQGLPRVAQAPMVIHYNGNTKPTMDNAAHYIEPMMFFRRKFIADRHGALPEAEVMQLLQAEDAAFKRKPPLAKRIINKIKTLI